MGHIPSCRIQAASISDLTTFLCCGRCCLSCCLRVLPFVTAFSFKVEVKTYCPSPIHCESGIFFVAICQKVMLLSKSIFCHFWRRKRKSLVKSIDTFLISSAIPFFLSSLFLRSPFHIEKSECTILCMVSRFLAALADLRFILSCSRLQSNVQCILSIDQ